jgi:hypothetical protein
MPVSSSYAGPSGANSFLALTPYGIGVPGSVVQNGGGGNTNEGGASGAPNPFFHNRADAQRSMYRQTPQAEYPDGYLGTIVSRQNDRLLNAIKARTTLPNYQRGVHKGARISMGDYFWVPEWNPNTGMQAEARGKRTGLVSTPNQVDMRDVIPASGALSPATLNPRAAELRRLMPTWRY